jgi:hypothetical protein
MPDSTSSALHQELRHELVAQALEQLGQHLEDAERNAADYVRAYVQALVEGRRTPMAPGLHPALAKLVREVVLDVDVAHRRRVA